MYSPLQPGCIRLLRPYKGDDDRDGYRTEEHRLFPPPRYIALSYTWGPATNYDLLGATARITVIIDGQDIEVHQNLHDALGILGPRFETAGCLLWVDYICINQADNEERSTQVMLMKDIYERATGVYAWLGLPDVETEVQHGVVLMRSFNKFLYDARKIHNDDMRVVQASITTGSYGFPSPDSAETIKAWNGISSMFERPYWRRTWVQQEATSRAPITFFCGRHNFDDVHLSATVFFGYVFAQFNGFDARHAAAAGTSGNAYKLSIARTQRQDQRILPLFERLALSRNSICGDPRDKVHALLGHIAGDISRWLTVDYTKSIANVYTDVVRFVLATEDRFALLFLGQINASTEQQTADDSMPSWVPDWRESNSMCDLLGISESGYMMKKAMYEPSPGSTVAVSIDNRRLTVRGFTFDAVTSLTEVCQIGASAVRTIGGWYDELRTQNVVFEDQTLDRSIVADVRFVTELRGIPRERYSVRGASADWNLLNTRPDALDHIERALRSNMGNQMMNICSGRRAGATDRGDIGIFPEATSLGDVVAAFHGGLALYVLRPLVSVVGQYRFIGECYVDGMMDGAAVNGTDQPGSGSRDIILV